MKTLLFLLIMTSNALAFYPGFLGNMKQMVAGTPDACSVCPMTASNGDTVCEDFEGTGYLCTSSPGPWTEAATGTGASVNEDATASGTLSCTDKGSHVLQMTYSSDAGTLYDNIAVSAMTTFYYKFYINVVETGLSASGNMPIWVVDGASYMNHRIQANWVSNTQYNLQLKYRNTSGSTAGSATTSTFTEDTWHVVAVEGVTNSNTLKMWVDGDLINTETDAANDADPVDFYFGRTGQAYSGVSGQFQIDNFKLDSTSMPADCL